MAQLDWQLNFPFAAKLIFYLLCAHLMQDYFLYNMQVLSSFSFFSRMCSCSILSIQSHLVGANQISYPENSTLSVNESQTVEQKSQE